MTGLSPKAGPDRANATTQDSLSLKSRNDDLLNCCSGFRAL